MSINRVILIGRMVRDPELRSTNSGKSVSSFTVAVQKRIKPADPSEPDADFIRVTAWNQTAQYIVDYGAKGRLVAVDGRLSTSKYNDRDGNPREAVEVIADNLSLLDRPREDSSSPTASRSSAQAAAADAAAGTEDFDPFAEE